MRVPLAASALVLTAGLAFASASARATAGRLLQDAPALAARVQQRYAAIRDFTADFVQSYQGGVLRTKTTERGTVALKRPGRMRWIYTSPDRKEFVSDGVRLYTYLVADKQVVVSAAPDADDGTTPALFLTGQADLARDFDASFTDLPGAAPGLLGLKLAPRTHDPDYEWFAVGVDPQTLQIRHLVAADRQGGRSAFAFSNLKENRGLTDKDFEFRIPRGVDVVTNGPRSR
jgi:outer membrane lipoprotein carrier protein